MFSELEITSFGLGLILLITIIATIGIIIFFKIKYKTYSPQSLSKANIGRKANSISEQTKFPEVDVFKITSSLFNFGLMVSVALCLAAMNWTSYEKKIIVDINDLKVTEEVEVAVPRTNEPPPPPPPPVIQEVPNTELITEDQPVFENQEVTMETKVEAPIFNEKKVAFTPPPPPPPPPSAVEEEIFKVVEQMPRFPGCESKSTDAEKSDCSKAKLLEYIYNNLKYPAIARENGIEGQVVIQFVVERDGSISDVNIIRDIGGGCGDSAGNVVKGMNNMGGKWIPGKQRGRPVRVLFTLPVKFMIAS